MEQNPVRLFGYSIMPLMIKKRIYSVRCLDCNAEVSAKVKSALGKDEIVLFFIFSKKKRRTLILTLYLNLPLKRPLKIVNRPLRFVLTSIDHFLAYWLGRF